MSGMNRKLDDISSFIQGMARQQASATATTAFSPLTTYTHFSERSLYFNCAPREANGRRDVVPPSAHVATHE